MHFQSKHILHAFAIGNNGLVCIKTSKFECLFKVSIRERNASTKTFEDFLKVLESMSKRAKNLRILQHLRFVYLATA